MAMTSRQLGRLRSTLMTPASFVDAHLPRANLTIACSRPCIGLSLPLRSQQTVQNHNTIDSRLLVPPRSLVPQENVSYNTFEELHEITLKSLQAAYDHPRIAMNMVDTLQRLGIGYHFEEEVKMLLEQFSDQTRDKDDLSLASLRFQLLRRNHHPTSPDTFYKFVDKKGNFKEALTKDIRGLLRLHEASSLRGESEDILSQAMEFSKVNLLQALPSMKRHIHRTVTRELECPRHRRTPRLEARHYFDEENRMHGSRSSALLEMAILEFNNVQLLHKREFAEISRWWSELGLVSSLSFARDRPMECFLWTVGIFPEPSHSSSRIELTKTIAILLVIDDIFDSYGSLDQLILFNDAIQRWDLGAMEQLPDYMKICYTALYNTTQSIADGIGRKYGHRFHIMHHLKRTWMDVFEAFLVEAKWYNRGFVATTMDEYLANAVTTGGTYMALVHTFFLLGNGVTQKDVALLDPYPQLFSDAGKILRLWDDLGTAKEEQARGNVASSIQCYMRENCISRDDDARRGIRQHIGNLWLKLNEELVAPNGLPLSIVDASFNLSRTAQIIYQHGDDNSASNIEDHVHALFFSPIAS